MILKYLVFGLGLNDPISPLYEQLDTFHDQSINILLLIMMVMCGMFYCVWTSSSFSKKFLDKKYLEMFWTLVPAFILIFLALPSLGLLYYMDIPFFQLLKTTVSGTMVKVMGNQWYWSYEYKKSLTNEYLSYDSFMVPENQLFKGGYRLLEVDKPLVLTCFSKKLIQGVSQDVMHSWTCPSFGVKFDVMPGRLNSSSLISTQIGQFYGQCSEICGSNHSFMPIEVEIVSAS